MTPPMVGVPALCAWETAPASSPSRTVSPSWRRRREAMIFLPANRATSRAVPAESPARTVTNWKTWKPGGW